MELPRDISEFIELLHSQKVEFLLVGGYALAFHGAPRFTEDIDFLINPTPENALKLEKVLHAFGFGGIGITREDFLQKEQVIQLGRPPSRIDLLTSISGVDWKEAWSNKVAISIGGFNC